MENGETIKKKSMDVSKGTVKMRVKERRKAERDRDDFDFVYPK